MTRSYTKITRTLVKSVKRLPLSGMPSHDSGTVKADTLTYDDKRNRRAVDAALSLTGNFD